MAPSHPRKMDVDRSRWAALLWRTKGANCAEFPAQPFDSWDRCVCNHSGSGQALEPWTKGSHPIPVEPFGATSPGLPDFHMYTYIYIYNLQVFMFSMIFTCVCVYRYVHPSSSIHSTWNEFWICQNHSIKFIMFEERRCLYAAMDRRFEKGGVDLSHASLFVVHIYIYICSFWDLCILPFSKSFVPESVWA